MALAAGDLGVLAAERKFQLAVIETRVAVNSVVARATISAKIGNVFRNKIRLIIAMTGLAFCFIELGDLLVVTIDARERLSVRQSLVGSQSKAQAIMRKAGWVDGR